jgi:membrane-associated phospholipid phosphatase
MAPRLLARLVGALAALGLLAAFPSAADEPAPAPAEEQAPAPAAPAPAPTSAPLAVVKRVGKSLYSDFRWSVNNLEADGEDVIKSPLHAPELLTEPSFYWTLVGSGALLGGAYAGDEWARDQFIHISHKDAQHLESWGNTALWGGTALLYGYGLVVDEPRAREYALTGLLSTGVSGLLTSALKASFGRLRPREGKGHNQWFQGGSSFVSGATTPAFALAADLSEYADNRWYVALPAYTAAASVGLGRMAKDAHWLSDVAGSALLGVGTTELLLHMHAMHAADPTRYRVFPLVVDRTIGLGVTVAF